MYTGTATQTSSVSVAGKVCEKERVSDSYMMSTAAGYLCGECRNSTGVSALLNNCVSCSDGWITLVVLLGMVMILDHSFLLTYSCITQTHKIIILSAMLDVLTIIVVVLADIQVPQLLYGCLFFIQVSQILNALVEFV